MVFPVESWGVGGLRQCGINNETCLALLISYLMQNSLLLKLHWKGCANTTGVVRKLY